MDSFNLGDTGLPGDEGNGDNFPLIDESALNLDFGPEQPQQQTNQNNGNPAANGLGFQGVNGMGNMGNVNNTTGFGGQIGMNPVPQGANTQNTINNPNIQIPGTGNFNGNTNQQHPNQTNSAKSALMAKFMSLTPEQRRMLMQRQQYRQAMRQRQATNGNNMMQQGNVQPNNMQNMQNINAAPYVPNMGNMPANMPGMSISQNNTPSPQNPQNNQKMQNSHPAKPATPVPGNSQGHNMSVAQQFGPQNVEKFLIILGEFMARRGTPLIQKYPAIGGRQMNLFLIYYLVSKMGGFVHVLKSGKIPFIASRLGLDPSNRELLTQFVQMYHKSLFPFEQFASTPEGMRQLAARRQQLQAQLHERNVAKPNVNKPAQKPSNQNTPNSNGQVQTPHPLQPQVQIRPSNASAISNSATPIPGSVPASVNNTPKVQPKNSRRKSSQASIPSQKAPSRAASSGVSSPAVTGPAGTPKPTSTSHNGHTNTHKNGPRRSPDFARNYIPHNGLLTKTAGFNLEAMQTYGQQLDHLKPVFLYFPELGKVSIHALTMALKSQLDAEVNVALNVLLIVTSDPSFFLPLERCKELLDTLCQVGEHIARVICLDTADEDSEPAPLETDEVPFKHSKIDDVFAKYQSMYNNSNGEDRKIVIDSLTADELGTEDKADGNSSNASETPLSMDGSDKGSSSGSTSDTDDSNLMDSENMDGEMKSKAITKKPTEFGLPAYLDILHDCRDQEEDFEYGVHTMSYQNPKLMHVEQLSTISMVLRNFSFINSGDGSSNSLCLATNTSMLHFLFTMIESVATHPKAMKLARKRLCLMKDTLITLSNISHAIELHSPRELLLIISLCLSFGSKMSPYDKSNGFITPRIDPIIDKYHFHGVDVLAKILSGSRNNKSLLRDLFTADSLDSETRNYLVQLAGPSDAKDGSLALKLFSFFISTIPLDMLHRGDEPFSSKLSSCLEALLGSLVVLQMAGESDFNRNIALEILSAPEDIANGLVHLSFVYAAIYVNTNFETKIQHAYVSSRASQLVNTLVKQAIDYSKSHGTLKQDSEKLCRLLRLFSNDNNLIGVLITPNAPSGIAAQVVETVKLISRLKKLSTAYKCEDDDDKMMD